MGIGRKAAWCFLAVAILIGVWWLTYEPAPAPPAPLLRVNSSRLGSTRIVPSLEVPIASGQSLIYCGSIQLAWNELRGLAQGDVVVEGASECVSQLNAAAFSKGDLAEAARVCKAGTAANGIVAAINRELVSKFHSEIEPLTVALSRPDDLLVYGAIVKDVKFEPNLEEIEDGLRFGGSDGDTRVRAFGFKEFSSGNERQGELVAYWEGTSASLQFVVRLGRPEDADEVVLAKMTPQETLSAAAQEVLATMKTGPPRTLREKTRLSIPKFNYDIIHSYAELCGKRLKNAPLAGYIVVDMIQGIRFRLDERGATFRSFALASLTKSMPPRFIFDRPFLLMMKEKRSPRPYLVMWVDNAELMTKIKE